MQPSNIVRPARLVTLNDLGIERLLSLACALDLSEVEMRTAVEIFQLLSQGWGTASLRAAPRFASDITDDHTPFEFSLALDDIGPELRFLTEAQADVPSLRANWDAAFAVNRALAQRFGVDLTRLEQISDLFTPSRDCQRFALWHAVCLRPSKAPDFKIYLNPQANGVGHARSVVAEAMARLGLARAWQRIPSLGADDEPCYFSLDLAARAGARVKVYIAHQRADLARIERAVSTAHGFVPGRAARFCEAMAGSAGPYSARPVLTCLSFVEGRLEPSAATVHFPIRSYASDDAAAEARVRSELNGEASSLYAQALRAVSRRSLADRSGMQTYASLRLEEGQRMTVYLAPEAYATPVRQSVRPSTPSVHDSL